jgi:hypothetical protein
MEIGRDGTYVIDHVIRLKNSVNGNPRYDVHFTNGERYRTESDGSVNYDIPNLTMSKDKGRPVTVKLTRRGQIQAIDFNEEKS